MYISTYVCKKKSADIQCTFFALRRVVNNNTMFILIIFIVFILKIEISTVLKSMCLFLCYKKNIYCVRKKTLQMQCFFVYLLFATYARTAKLTLAPTIGLLPIPTKPIMST